MERGLTYFGFLPKVVQTTQLPTSTLVRSCSTEQCQGGQQTSSPWVHMDINEHRHQQSQAVPSMSITANANLSVWKCSTLVEICNILRFRLFSVGYLSCSISAFYITFLQTESASQSLQHSERKISGINQTAVIILQIFTYEYLWGVNSCLGVLLTYSASAWIQGRYTKSLST